MDLPASPPNTTLQVALATAINTSTNIPIHILRFQKAMAKAVRDIGTKDESWCFHIMQDSNYFTLPIMISKHTSYTSPSNMAVIGFAYSPVTDIKPTYSNRNTLEQILFASQSKKSGQSRLYSTSTLPL